jgi:hypothetical protein
LHALIVDTIKAGRAYQPGGDGHATSF